MPDKTSANAAPLSANATGQAQASMKVTARVKVNLSLRHIASARLFARHAQEIEEAESAVPWPQPHQAELQSYALQLCCWLSQLSKLRSMSYICRP